MASKYFAKFTKEEFDEWYKKIHDDAYKQGFKEGHLNGLALATAYIYEHVMDLDGDDCDSNWLKTSSEFEHEVTRMRRKISDQKITMMKRSIANGSEEKLD